MRFLKAILPWKTAILLSVIVLVSLDVFSFYRLYTNTFDFLKFDSFIIPIFSLIHLAYLYMLWFKIKRNELGTVTMRNLEYFLYIIFVIYTFKIFETGYILSSYTEYETAIFPKTFLPMGTVVLLLYLILLVFTSLSFVYRKSMVGSYHFDEINQHLDSYN